MKKKCQRKPTWTSAVLSAVNTWMYIREKKLSDDSSPMCSHAYTRTCIGIDELNSRMRTVRTQLCSNRTWHRPSETVLCCCPCSRCPRPLLRARRWPGSSRRGIHRHSNRPEPHGCSQGARDSTALLGPCHAAPFPSSAPCHYLRTAYHKTGHACLPAPALVSWEGRATNPMDA